MFELRIVAASSLWQPLFFANKATASQVRVVFLAMTGVLELVKTDQI